MIPLFYWKWLPFSTSYSAVEKKNNLPKADRKSQKVSLFFKHQTNESVNQKAITTRNRISWIVANFLDSNRAENKSKSDNSLKQWLTENLKYFSCRRPALPSHCSICMSESGCFVKDDATCLKWPDADERRNEYADESIGRPSTDWKLISSADLPIFRRSILQ